MRIRIHTQSSKLWFIINCLGNMQVTTILNTSWCSKLPGGKLGASPDRFVIVSTSSPAYSKGRLKAITKANSDINNGKKRTERSISIGHVHSLRVSPPRRTTGSRNNSRPNKPISITTESRHWVALFQYIWRWIDKVGHQDISGSFTRGDRWKIGEYVCFTMYEREYDHIYISAPLFIPTLERLIPL
jgi:hypothetical protein